MRRLRARVARPAGEDGIVMLLVIGLGFVLTIVSLGILNAALNGTRSARHDQDYTGALAAADSGIDDYLYRLNNDSSYVVYDTVPNTCGGGNVAANPDSSNTAMSAWATLPGGAVTGTSFQPQFRYDVDISKFCSQGSITVTASGKVNKTVRSEQVQVKRRGFLDYIYYTDHEDQDPALYNTNPFANNVSYPAPDDDPQSVCGRHYYDPSADGLLAAPRPDDVAGNNPGCGTINFGGGDVIQGPLHTNDALLVCGSVTFNGPAYTSWGFSPSGPQPSGTQHWRGNPGCANSPSFVGNKSVNPPCLVNGATNDACVEAPLNMPPSNGALKAETDPNLTASPGCLYTGPTKITFNSTGTMDVVSPDTTLNSATIQANCAVGSGVARPANGVIFVQDVPPGASQQACTSDNGVGFDNNDTPYPASDSRVTEKNLINPVGYPQANDVTASPWPNETLSYPCDAGDAFVSGTLKGRITIGTDRNVDIVGNLQYNSGVSGNDLLGLIANRYVEVYHPVSCTFDGGGNCTSRSNLNLPGTAAAFTNPVIQAAMMSVQHSFRVQNYADGASLGTLNVTGAIAQDYRGIVGVIGQSGYTKNYVYDSRLKYQTPPKFVSPVQAPFQVSSYSEQKPAY